MFSIYQIYALLSDFANLQPFGLNLKGGSSIPAFEDNVECTGVGARRIRKDHCPPHPWVDSSCPLTDRPKLDLLPFFFRYLVGSNTFPFSFSASVYTEDRIKIKRHQVGFSSHRERERERECVCVCV